MLKNPRLLMVAGILALLIGAVLSVAGGPPKADAAMAAQCRTRFDGQADMQKRCDEAAFATAMTATDAAAAAKAISAANTSEVGGNSLAMFIIGLGVALLLAGVLQMRKARALGTGAPPAPRL
ncbi:MAG: hypothetical protein V4505_02900 [Pseudomonadota bacterium]